MTKTSGIDVAKIGAGPCGHSAAAHLAALVGIAQRVFGTPLVKLGHICSMNLQVQVKHPKALLRSLISSGRCTTRDWALFAYLLPDPWPLLMERAHLTV